MKRLLGAMVATLLLAGLVFADDGVRALQAKLKSGGFYFGKVDGQSSTELSAAITRYQIRNGLPITGQLDAGTSKALGVPMNAKTASEPTTSATWRELRKDDQQKTPNESPTHALQPAPGDGTKLVLSRERLRDYIAAFVLAGLDPQIGAELEFFGDRVHYYNDGIVDREKIRRDLQRYAARWPQRRFTLAGDLQVNPQPDSTVRVTFPLRYEVQNGSKHASGIVRKTIQVQVVGEDLQIVGVNERKSG